MIFDRLQKLFDGPKEAVKSRLESLAVKAFGGVMLASFLGSLLALKGCG